VKASNYGLQKDSEGDWTLVHIKTGKLYKRMVDRYDPIRPWHRRDSVPPSERHPDGFRWTKIGVSSQGTLQDIFEQKQKEAKQ
jgi:hypothetical protein